MNNRKKTGKLLRLDEIETEKIEEEEKGISTEGKNYSTRFKPGQSGNPNGRPRKTEEEKNTLEKIKALAPKAVDEMEKILDSSKVSMYAKIQVIDIILNRTYGRPEAALKLEAIQSNPEESAARISSIIEQIRARKGMES